jgi:hypothetical protein
MKTLILFIPLLLSGMVIHGQSQTQQVIATSGGNDKNSDISIAWTIGEPVIATLSTGTAVLTQGFHQPDLEVTVIQSLDGLPYTVEAYPNPTDELLLIQLKNAEARDFQYHLFDMNGKILEQNSLESDITAVNMQNYPAGVYLLKVMQKDTEIKTFEIIKH